MAMSPAPRTPTPAGRPSLARRALPAIVLTGASVTFLHALDRPAASAETAGDGGVVPSATPVGNGTPVTITLPTTLAPATTVAPVATAAPLPGADAPVTTAAPATTVPVTTAAPTAAVVCTTYDGPGVWTKWGTVQVEASIAPDGTICTIDAIQTPNDRRKSVAINERAVPILNANALAAQSTNFDGVSGATVTSNGYKSSLQALLDGLG